MEITEVHVKRVAGENKTRATASIVLDGVFVVRDLRVVETEKGPFVAMPSRRAANGEFRDIAYPITAEAREMIQRAVLAAYEKVG
ncbi:MAG: septation regulator SpoVG [Chitinophagales bacterium]